MPIVIGAHLEDRLAELVSARLPDNPEARRLAGIEGGRTSYGQLVKLVRALGIVGEEAHRTLVSFGKVRNHFAHEKRPSESDANVFKPLMDLHRRVVGEWALDLPEADREREASDLLRRLEQGLQSGTDETLIRGLLVGVFSDLWIDFVCIQHTIEEGGRLEEIVPPVPKPPGW